MFEDEGFRADDDVVVVHAHPDDEVFCTGAAILAAKAAGARVRLRVFTGGEGRSVELTPAALADARERRTAKLTAACAHLGVDEWDYLTVAGEWTDTPHHREATMAAASPDALAGAVTRFLDDERPTIVLTVGPDGLTGHPDHIACHRAVASALTRAAWGPRLALGAVLDQAHVEAAQQQARRLFGAAIGSGRVRGLREPQTQKVTASTEAQHLRRLALDVYTRGLGTAPVEDLTKLSQPWGDSVLLRLVLDTSGWDTDHFLPL